MVGGITGWLYRVYSIKNLDFSRCDAVVALGYGLLKNKKLPDAERKTLAETVQIASKFNAPIGRVNEFWFFSTEQDLRRDKFSLTPAFYFLR